MIFRRVRISDRWFTPRANSLFSGDIDTAGKNTAVLNLLPYASEDMSRAEKIANQKRLNHRHKNGLRNIFSRAEYKKEEPACAGSPYRGYVVRPQPPIMEVIRI
ncbi:hypothetical protein LR61_04770 [Morganella morganii]|nr:hypothetical protein LR61_04770 [Morganella morganii]